MSSSSTNSKSSECPVGYGSSFVKTPDSGCPIGPIKNGGVENSTNNMNNTNLNTTINTRTWGMWASSFFTSKSNNSTNNSKDIYNPQTNDIIFGQEKQPGQKIDLNTERDISSILKSDFSPAHQPKDTNKWVYPSEQQYFNAMKRKGYNVNEKDIPVVLKIHNIANEEGWQRVKQWETLKGNPEVKLKQFSGRPDDLTPKARMWMMLGYKRPFDRHDWIVERPNGETVRYVLDYYEGSKDNTMLQIDVRPALDTPTAAVDRLYVFAMQNFVGTNPLKKVSESQNKN